MKVLHLNAGAETGGGMVHIISLLDGLDRKEMILGLFEEGALYAEAKKRGIQTVIFKQTSRYDLSIIKQIASFITKENIDIIHTHGPRANLYALILKRVVSKSCTWMSTVHSDPGDDFLGRGLKGKAFTYLNILAFKNMDHLLAISNRFSEMLVNYGVKDSKITTIYNGIDFNIPDSPKITRSDLGYEETDFLIIMVARLSMVKGHTIALKALSEIAVVNSRVKLLLVGSGELEEDLIKEVKQRELTEHVKFLGHHNHVHSLLALSDLEILTSYSESFPLVVLEAARAQVPVISTDVGGVRDLIISDEYGWVVPVGDTVKLKEAILKAVTLKENGGLKLIGSNLHKRASINYSIESFRLSVYNTYKKILKTGK